jgi:hypothetical protein
MDLIELWNKKHGKNSVEFSVCSGGKLKSNNQAYMDRTNTLVENGMLRILIVIRLTAKILRNL